MGGRGAFWDGSYKDYLTREFDSIGSLDGIKILQVRDGLQHLQFPLYSHSKKTTYFVVDKNDPTRIHTIGFYRNHELIKSVDLNSNGKNHWHDWKDGVVTKKGVTTHTRVKIKIEQEQIPSWMNELIRKARKWKPNE